MRTLKRRNKGSQGHGKEQEERQGQGHIGADASPNPSAKQQPRFKVSKHEATQLALAQSISYDWTDAQLDRSHHSPLKLIPALGMLKKLHD
jgi:hypothetical protein